VLNSNRMCRALLVVMSVAIAHAQGTLSGVVVDESTAKPIPGASVGVGRVSQLMTQATTTADDAGRFEFTSLSSGPYWVECASEGYVEIEGYSLDGPRAVVLTGVVTPITIRLIPSGSIEGQLLADNGEPIPGAAVEAVESGKKGAVTGADGRFLLLGLPPGEYKLRARLDALRRARLDTAASFPTTPPRIVFYPDVPDAASGVPIPIAKGVQVRGVDFGVKRVPMVTVAGVVIDSRTGAPLENGKIELRPEDTISPSDAIPRVFLKDGAFRFDLVPPGSYRAYVYRSAAAGAPPFITTIEAGATGAADLRIAMPFGGRLTGTVRGPRAGLRALHLTPTGSFVSASVEIDVDGRFTFEGLAPGKWTFGFQGGPSASRITIKSIRQGDRVLFPYVEVVDGDNPPLEVEFTEMLHVTGVVVDRSGKPVEQAIVMFYGEEPSGRRFNFSGKDGNFDIGIAAGDFRVSAFRIMPPRQMNGCDTTQPIHLTGSLTGLKLALCP
jgi:protocatechuate 3,4-dioxygenase beta subunit